MTCAAKRNDFSPDHLDAAREAMVEAYYALADAYVQTSLSAATDDEAVVDKQLQFRRLTALEDALRDAALVLAQEARRDQHGDAGASAQGPAGQKWLKELSEQIEALSSVRQTGMNGDQARNLFRLKQILNEVTAI